MSTRTTGPWTIAALLVLLLGAGPAAARDRGADGDFSERRSRHFLLLQDVAIDRYSGPSGSRRFEHDVLATLEDAYRRVRDVLGLGPSREVQVRVYDPAIFDRQFGAMFRFRAAGFYNGLIHVRGGTDVDAALIRTLHHEYVHAALGAAAAPGTFPGWLNEGLAEYFERLSLGRRHLTFTEFAALQRAVRAGAWIPLANMGMPSFQHLGAEAAWVAYLESYAAVEYLARTHGERSLRDLCAHLIRRASLERALQKTYRDDLDDIEAALLSELR